MHLTRLVDRHTMSHALAAKDDWTCREWWICYDLGTSLKFHMTWKLVERVGAGNCCWSNCFERSPCTGNSICHMLPCKLCATQRQRGMKIQSAPFSTPDGEVKASKQHCSRLRISCQLDIIQNSFTTHLTFQNVQFISLIWRLEVARCIWRRGHEVCIHRCTSCGSQFKAYSNYHLPEVILPNPATSSDLLRVSMQPSFATVDLIQYIQFIPETFYLQFQPRTTCPSFFCPFTALQPSIIFSQSLFHKMQVQFWSKWTLQSLQRSIGHLENVWWS